MAANDGNTADFPRIDWKRRLVVLQKNNTPLLNSLCDVQSFGSIDHALLGRIVHHARQELGVQNSPRMVVNLRHRYLSSLNRLLQLRTEIISHRLLLVEASRGGLQCAVGSTPV